MALVLVKLAQLAADVPEIRELDINPFLADENGVIAVDARVVGRCGRGGAGPAAIRASPMRPYPKEWERHRHAARRKQGLRAPGAARGRGDLPAFFKQVSDEDLRLRFFAPVREFSHAFIARS